MRWGWRGFSGLSEPGDNGGYALGVAGVFWAQ